MALISADVSSKHLPSKSSAIRSFPPISGLASSSSALQTKSGSLTSDRNVSQLNVMSPSPEPTSRGSGSGFLSYRGNIKRPIVFAVRSFPKGCGPLATATPKPSLSKEASVGGITEEGIDLGKVMEDAVLGRSLGEKDAQKSNKKSSQIPDLVEGNGRFYRPEGSESNTEAEEMEEKLNDVVRKITEDARGLGKILENDAAGRYLSEKGDEKPIRKSSSGFFKGGENFSGRPNFKSKMELNNVVRKIPEGGNGSAKEIEKSVVGRSLREKDGKKPSKKPPLTPDSFERGRGQSGQLLECRYERLIVQALMASKRCPWRQSKRRSSSGLQSRPKKARVGESGNSAEK